VTSLNRFALPFAGLAVATVGLLSIAVSSGRAQPQPVPTVEQAYTAAVTAQVALATYQMDNAGLHALDEATAKGEITTGALGRVRRARIVVAATQWPDSMKSTAGEFVEHAVRLESALQAENAALAHPDAAELHEIGHKLSDMAYTWLVSMGGATSGSVAPAASESAGRRVDSGDHPHDMQFRHPAGIEVPTLTLEVLPDALSGYNIHIVTTNWTWTPERVNTAPVPNEGHAHLYVDGQKVARVYGPWYYLSGLSAGPHTIRVTLNANDHADYATVDGRMLDAVTVVQ
jgi:hypothetical protein